MYEQLYYEKVGKEDAIELVLFNGKFIVAYLEKVSDEENSYNICNSEVFDNEAEALKAFNIRFTGDSFKKSTDQVVQ